MPTSFSIVGDAANDFYPDLKQNKVEEMNLAVINENDRERESREEDGGDAGEIENNSSDEMSDDDVSVGSNYLEEFLIPNTNPNQPPIVTYEMHETAMRNLNSRWEDEIEHTVHESEKLIEQQNMVSKEERDVMQIRHQNELQQAMSVAMENEEQMLQMKTEYEDTLERQSDQMRHLSNENKNLIQQLEEHKHGLESAIELAIETVQKELEESAREEQKNVIESLQNQMKNERKKSETTILNLEQQLADTSEVFNSYKNEKDSQKEEFMEQNQDKIDTINKEKDAMQKLHIREMKERKLYFEKLLKKTQKQADADYRGIIKAMKQNMNHELLQMKLEYESLLLMQNPTFNSMKDRSYQSKEETIIFDTSIDSVDNCIDEDDTDANHVDTSLFMNEYYDSQTMQNHLKTISSMTDKKSPLLTQQQAQILSSEIKKAIEVERNEWEKKLKQTLHEQKIKHDLKMQQTITHLTKQQQKNTQQNNEQKVKALYKEVSCLENAKHVLEGDLKNALRALKEYKSLLKQNSVKVTPTKKEIKGFGGLKTYWEGASSQQHVGARPAPNNNNNAESTTSSQSEFINVNDAADNNINDNNNTDVEPLNRETNGHLPHEHSLQIGGNLGGISSNDGNPATVVISVGSNDNATNSESLTNGTLSTHLSSSPQAFDRNNADRDEISSDDTEVHQNTSPVPQKTKKHVSIVSENRLKKSPTSQRSRSLSRSANASKESPTKSPGTRSRSLSRVRNTDGINQIKSPNSRSRSLSRVRITAGSNSAKSSDPEQKSSVSNAASENKRSPRSRSRPAERRNRTLESNNNTRRERSVSRPPGSSSSKHTKKIVFSSRLKTSSTESSNNAKLQRSKDKVKPQPTSNSLRKLSKVRPSAANNISSSTEEPKTISKITNSLNEENAKSTPKEIPASDPITFKDTRIMVLNMTLNPEMRKLINMIGATLIERVEDALFVTHIVAGGTNGLRRTSMMMIGLCRTTNIIHVDWLWQCFKKRKLLPCSRFLLLSDRVSEKRYAFSIKQTVRNGQERRKEGGLFFGWKVYFSEGVAGHKAPAEKDLNLIIKAGGGEILHKSDLSSEVDDRAHVIVITSDPPLQSQLDDADATKLADGGAGRFTTTWLFDCILHQKLSGIKRGLGR